MVRNSSKAPLEGELEPPVDELPTVDLRREEAMRKARQLVALVLAIDDGIDKLVALFEAIDDTHG